MMTIEQIDIEIKSIDSRVLHLEKINDEYAARNGIINSGIYDQIQKLMDRRDELYIMKLDMGGI